MKVPIYNEKTIQNKETLESNTKQRHINEKILEIPHSSPLWSSIE